jgi:hypothetical protein
MVDSLPCLFVPNYTALLSRFTLAHLALCAAAILLRPAAEIVRFGLAALCFAHRALCATLIFRPAAPDIV